MLDYTAMILAIGPELWLAAAGLVGVLLGALLKDRFNSLSFKYGALALFGGEGPPPPPRRPRWTCARSCSTSSPTRPA